MGLGQAMGPFMGGAIHIRSGPHLGTLHEVAGPHVALSAAGGSDCRLTIASRSGLWAQKAHHPSRVPAVFSVFMTSVQTHGLVFSGLCDMRIKMG